DLPDFVCKTERIGACPQRFLHFILKARIGVDDVPLLGRRFIVAARGCPVLRMLAFSGSIRPARGGFRMFGQLVRFVDVLLAVLFGLLFVILVLVYHMNYLVKNSRTAFSALLRTESTTAK